MVGLSRWEKEKSVSKGVRLKSTVIGGSTTNFLAALMKKQNKIQRERRLRTRDARVRSGSTSHIPLAHFDLHGMSVHNDREYVLLSFPSLAELHEMWRLHLQNNQVAQPCSNALSSAWRKNKRTHFTMTVHHCDHMSKDRFQRIVEHMTKEPTDTIHDD